MLPKYSADPSLFLSCCSVSELNNVTTFWGRPSMCSYSAVESLSLVVSERCWYSNSNTFSNLKSQQAQDREKYNESYRAQGFSSYSMIQQLQPYFLVSVLSHIQQVQVH